MPINPVDQKAFGKRFTLGPTSTCGALAILLCTTLLCPGCQSGANGLPNLSTLNNPVRVPPPAPGSFSVPSSYNNGAGTSSNAIGTGALNTSSISPTGTTMSSLRSLETGEASGTVFGSEGSFVADVQATSIKSKAVVGQPVSPEKASTAQFNRSLQAAAAAFSDNTGTGPVVPAVAQQELPDPRSSLANSAPKNDLSVATPSLGADSVTWRNPKK